MSFVFALACRVPLFSVGVAAEALLSPSLTVPQEELCVTLAFGAVAWAAALGLVDLSAILAPGIAFDSENLAEETTLGCAGCCGHLEGRKRSQGGPGLRSDGDVGELRPFLVRARSVHWCHRPAA